MTSAHRHMLLLIILLASSAVSLAQVQTGTPPFGTFGGGPDVINLANLNNHLTIPVFHRPGRGLNFEFTLTYDSSFWLGATSSSWQPATNWGWGTGGSDIGRISFAVSGPTNCIVSGRVVGTKTFWSNWVYYDGSGTSHPFYEAVKKPNVQNGPENLSQLEVLRAIIHTSPDIFLIQKMYEKQGK